MIHYQLVCGQDHSFDGWFRDSGAFDRQVGAGMLACPECGSSAVHRALMTPSIGRSRKKRDAVVDQAGREEPAAEAPAAEVRAAPEKVVMPDKVRAVLQRLRAEVEKNCEHVGDRFADEARAIHRGESDKRGIYGESTREEAEALAEEGIEIARVPWVPRADG